MKRTCEVVWGGAPDFLPCGEGLRTFCLVMNPQFIGPAQLLTERFSGFVRVMLNLRVLPLLRRIPK